jgi:hypothetical protein
VIVAIWGTSRGRLQLMIASCLPVALLLQRFSVTTRFDEPAAHQADPLPADMQLVAQLNKTEASGSDASVPPLMVVSSLLASGQTASLSTSVTGEPRLEFLLLLCCN